MKFGWNVTVCLKLPLSDLKFVWLKLRVLLMALPLGTIVSHGHLDGKLMHAKLARTCELVF